MPSKSQNRDLFFCSVSSLRLCLSTMGNQPVTQRTRKAPGALVKYRPSAQASQAQIFGYNSHCRLYRRATYEPIPVQRVDVSVHILHTMAQVTVKQVYLNTSPSPMECTYVIVFIVDPNATQHFTDPFSALSISNSIS